MSTTLADNQCSKMIKEGQKYARCLNAREAGKLACPTHIVSSVAPIWKSDQIRPPRYRRPHDCSVSLTAKSSRETIILDSPCLEAQL